jgi:cysteine desulfurase
MTAARTYLDYNASAPLRPEARAAMLAALDVGGNPSSVHAEGRQARTVIETARTAVADLIGARAADVVFTSGATEANASALAGRWDTIFLSGVEHDSVRANARKSGARLVELPVRADGRLPADAIAELLGRTGKAGLGRALLCVQLANNETGVIQPVTDIAAVAHAHGVNVLCDAVQAPGRLPVDCATLGADFVSLSAHKLGGPKGVGALVIVDGAPLPALISGGGQERGRRAGTENLPGIAGFGAAAAAARADLAAITAAANRRDALEATVLRITPDAVVVGQQAPRLANTCCLALAGLAAETAVIRLDLAGIAVSAGAACSSGKVGHSATLAAMGLDPALSRAAIRISLGADTSDADIAAFLAAWTHLTKSRARAA